MYIMKEYVGCVYMLYVYVSIKQYIGCNIYLMRDMLTLSPGLPIASEEYNPIRINTV